MSYKDIPIVAVTASAIKGDKERCIEAGMSDYVSKPIQLLELTKVLDRWLSGEYSQDRWQDSPEIEPVPAPVRDQAALDRHTLDDLRQLDQGHEHSIIEELGNLF